MPPVADSEQSGLGKRLSALLKVTKPYRELIGIAAAAIALLSGAVAWAVAHFATEAELFYLECRINNNIAAQSLPLQTEAFTTAIEWRTSQIKQITQLYSSPAANAQIAQLSGEINDLMKKSQDASLSFQKKIADMSEKCNTEAPSRGGGK
jgi:hypothetical protein